MGDVGDYWRDIKEASEFARKKAIERYNALPWWKRKRIEKRERKEIEEASLKREAEVKKEAQDRREEIEKLGVSVKVLTPYQFRINEVLDIFPTNKRYHDLKNNLRGDYEELHEILQLLK